MPIGLLNALPIAFPYLHKLSIYEYASIFYQTFSRSLDNQCRGYVCPDNIHSLEGRQK